LGILTACPALVVDPTDPVATCDFKGGDVDSSLILSALCSPYTIEESIEVRDDAVLTIEPGTELRFDMGKRLLVGGRNDSKLVARGTAVAPIVFTAKTPAAGARGQWRGIFFGQHTLTGSVIEHAKVSFGGESGLEQRGCITIKRGPANVLAIRNVIFSDCAQAGLSVSGGALADIANITVKDSDFGLWFAAENIGNIKTPFEFQGVNYNRILNTEVERSATWVAQPIPWRADEGVHVQGADAPVLTLAAGIHIQFDAGHRIRVGEPENGSLMVKGSATAPVILESEIAGASKGAWRGIYFGDKTGPNTQLDYAIVRHGGDSGLSQRGCVSVRKVPTGRISITNSVFDTCAQSGIAATVSEEFAFAAVSNNTFRDSDAGLWLDAATVGSVDGTQTYEGVDRNLMDSGLVSETATWTAQGIPWRVEETIEVEGANGPILTLGAGLELQFKSGVRITVGQRDIGALVAEGTAMAPVVLTSANATPVAGDWGGIMFLSQTTSETNLSFVNLSYAGEGGLSQRGGITLKDTRQTVSISDSTFSDNDQSDIYVDCDSEPTLMNNSYGSMAGIVNADC